jgi:hypothetical protein
MTNPLEDMLLPCPLDFCDGDGIIHQDDGSDGANDYPCPCRSEEGNYDELI